MKNALIRTLFFSTYDEGSSIDSFASRVFYLRIAECIEYEAFRSFDVRSALGRTLYLKWTSTLEEVTVERNKL